MIKVQELELKNDQKLNNLLVLRWDIFGDKIEAERAGDTAAVARWNRLFIYVDWHIGMMKYMAELCEGMK